MVIWDHILPLRTAQIADLEMLYLIASSAPVRALVLISITAALFSLALWWLSPRLTVSGYRCQFIVSPFACRPLATLSAMLSCWFPTNKWLGLQHAGLSHLWQENKPSGTPAPKMAKAILCVPIKCLGSPIVRAPYPMLVLAPCQFQHPVEESV